MSCAPVAGNPHDLGSSIATAAVPEPTSLVMLLVGLAAMVGRRRQAAS